MPPCIILGLLSKDLLDLYGMEADSFSMDLWWSETMLFPRLRAGKEAPVGQ